MAIAYSRTLRDFVRIRVANLIILGIGVLFLADAVTAMLQFIQAPFSRISLVVRLLFEVFYLILLLARLRETAHFFIGALFLTICFVVSAFIGGLIFFDYSWGENLVIFNKLLWLFLSWYVLKTYIKNPKDQKKLFYVYEGIIFIQSMCIFLGFLFKIPAFASYEAYRFGYKGLLPAQNEASFFYIIAFFYCAVQFTRYQRCRLLLLITSIAAAMTGTKVGFGILILLVFFVVFIWGIQYPKYTWGILGGIFLVIMLIFINWQVLYERIMPTISYFSSRFENGQSLASLVTSGRLDLLSYPKLILQKYPFVVITGGYNLSLHPVEMDPVDIFLSIGLIGAIIYYYWLLAITIPWPIRFNIQMFFVVVLLIISTVAGHFSYSAIGGTYCAVLLLAFRDKNHHFSLN